MAAPSEYELAVWRDIQHFKDRPLSAALRSAGEGVSNGAAAIGRRAASYLADHPGAGSAVSRGRGIVAKGASAIGTGARKAAGVVPTGAADRGGTALGSMRRTVAKISRVGLSPKRVVELHQKRGHDVTKLSDLRLLDLEQIHTVRGRALSWYYPATAAVSGMGPGWSIVARIAGRFAEAFGHTLTKKGLGKVVPVAGILVGGTLNWTTLEGIVDTADMAYRRRFLLEKYPQLRDQEPLEGTVVDDREEDTDDGRFSVLDELAEEGGPDLR